MRRLLLYSHQDSEFDGLGRIEMVSIGHALKPRNMQLIVVSRHLHPCHAIPVGGCPIGMHDEIDAFERCAALAIDDLDGDFMVRRGDRPDGDAERTRRMRDPFARAREFQRPVMQADVLRCDSADLGVLERAGPRPDCAGKSAGSNDGSEESDKPRVRVIVDDDGPGLSPAEREQVALRGQRLDESKPGSGLGLSIVVELAGLYGGVLTLGTAPIGGLRAELALPGG